MFSSRRIASVPFSTARTMAGISLLWIGVLLTAPSSVAEDVLPFVDEVPEQTVAEPAVPASATTQLRVPEPAAPVEAAPNGNSEPIAPAPPTESTPPKADNAASTAKAEKAADASAAHASVTSAVPTKEGPAPTKAEQINRLRQTIEADQNRIEELRARLVDPKSEYNEADAEFREADRILQLGKRRIEELTGANKTADVEALKQPFEKARAAWDHAHERFENAIQTRETEKARIEALEDKIRHDVEALERLTGDRKEAASESAATPENGAQAPGSDAAATGTAASSLASETTIALASSETASKTDAAPAAETPVENNEDKKAPSKELAHAQANAAERNREADEAEREAASVSERLQMLDKNIELQQKLLEGARKRRDLANEARKALELEYKTKSLAGASHDDLEALDKKVTAAELRFDQGVDEVREGAETLDEMQSERASLQAQELAAMRVAGEKRKEADDAKGKVSSLENPFTPRNILQWFIDHGPRLLAILIGMLLLQMVARIFSRRIVMILARSGARGSREEREDRAKTLVSVFHNTASLVIFVGSILVACEEVGIAVGPLMGGAAVFGLAVAFGAQNLIRDYFYGFMILLENQYKLNDVIQIGSTSGQVERITLRVTVLRDIEGHAHFVPNGKIETVTNMTHGWSRALFEIGIAYKEDADNVMQVLLDLASELRRDPTFGLLILDDAEMLGVDGFGDSAVTIKFFIKTRPLKQWTVKRELLRRIKRRFDELGIEIPFPHRTVFHHQVEPAEKAATPTQEGWEPREAA